MVSKLLFSSAVSKLWIYRSLNHSTDDSVWLATEKRHVILCIVTEESFAYRPRNAVINLFHWPFWVGSEVMKGEHEG